MPESSKACYELIREKTHCKLYFDIDGEEPFIEGKDYAAIGMEDINSLWATIRPVLRDDLKIAEEDLTWGVDTSLMVGSRVGGDEKEKTWKYSFRLIVKSAVFEENDGAMKAFVLGKVNNIWRGKHAKLDISVYTKNRVMRIAGSYKLKEYYKEFYKNNGGAVPMRGVGDTFKMEDSFCAYLGDCKKKYLENLITQSQVMKILPGDVLKKMKITPSAPLSSSEPARESKKRKFDDDDDVLPTRELFTPGQRGEIFSAIGQTW